MSVMVMLEVPVVKAKMEGFLDVVRELLKETRAYDGCQKVETFVEEESGRVILMELWETAGHHQACHNWSCLLYTSPSPRDGLLSRMPSSA